MWRDGAKDTLSKRWPLIVRPSLDSSKRWTLTTRPSLVFSKRWTLDFNTLLWARRGPFWFRRTQQVLGMTPWSNVDHWLILTFLAPSPRHPSPLPFLPSLAFLAPHPSFVPSDCWTWFSMLWSVWRMDIPHSEDHSGCQWQHLDQTSTID